VTSKLVSGNFKETIEGSWKPAESAFIMVGSDLIEITELKYSIVQSVLKSEIVVERKGTAQLLVKAEDGSINKLLTDVDLRSVTFGADGEVILT
jgi:hypothetical protein